jgi:hypothetical protein
MKVIQRPKAAPSTLRHLSREIRRVRDPAGSSGDPGLTVTVEFGHGMPWLSYLWVKPMKTPEVISRARSVLVWGLTMGVPACGGNASSGHAAPVPESQATDSAVAAYCSGMQTCCSSKGFTFGASACDSNLHSEFGSAVCSAGSVYNAQAAGDCLAQLQAALANCSLDFAAAPACNDVCVGTVPAGSPCTNDTDCAKPAGQDVRCSVASSSSTTSICIVTPRGTAGSACNSTCTTSPNGGGCSVMGAAIGSPGPTGDAVCFTNDGLYCSTTDFTCHTLAAVGGDCTGYDGCVSGAYCDTSVSKCTAKAPAGGACPLGIECADGTYCSSSQVCATRKANGQPCSSSSECLGYCDLSTNTCADSLGFNPTAASCANPTIN